MTKQLFSAERPSEQRAVVNIMEESVEAVPSEESIMQDAPSEPTAPVVPPVEEPTAPVEPEAELFELPDGRKVDAETLSKEWKENFYPDYTRKSQELAKAKTPENLPEAPKNPFDNPDYVPKTYAEIVEAGKQAALRTLEEREQQRIEANQAIETAVETQLADVKKLDKGVDENALFLHATKYGFKDLKIAHQNMKDMSDMAKKVQKTTADNIAKRNDPVSIAPGANGAKSDPSHFATARDFLRSLK